MSHVVGTMGDLKAWVQAGAPKQVGADQVLLNITHNLLQAQFPEIPFSLHSTILSVKERVAGMTGSQVDTMDLILGGQAISVSNSNHDKPLGYFGPSNGAVLHVIDNNPFSLARNGGLEDVSQVEKYVMSDEEYAKRDNTYRAFKQKQLAADPNWKPVHAQTNVVQQARRAVEGVVEESEQEIRARIQVGQRCSVFPGDRRGEVMYVGLIPEFKTKEQNIIWIGVKYDLPCGKNDGHAEGKRYFEALQNYGAFCRANVVTTGDYPPEADEFDEEL